MPGSFINDDLAAFFDTDELADTATYNGSSFGVQFFNEYEVASLLEIEVENAAPYIICRDSDIQGITQGVRITVGAAPADDSFQIDADGMFISDADGQFDESGQTEYIVRGVQPDGTGITTLILSRD